MGGGGGGVQREHRSFRGWGRRGEHARDPGRAVQVHPMRPKFKPPGIQRLKLKYDLLLSNLICAATPRRPLKQAPLPLPQSSPGWAAKWEIWTSYHHRQSQSGEVGNVNSCGGGRGARLLRELRAH